MLAALLTTFLFATSAVCGYRASRLLGGIEANFWRITFATIFLTLWAFTFGSGLSGAPGWFILSGFFGIGLGDTAYYQALPRLGSRRAVLVTQCLTAPFAALIEWLWLGGDLPGKEILCIAVILAGVAIALKPDDHLKISLRDWKLGIIASTLAALGGASGTVIIRKGYAVLHDAGLQVDVGTTGYQRMIGGMVIPAAAMLLLKGRTASAHGPVLAESTLKVSRDKWQRVWPWVLATALAGQTLGVTAMQWALKTTPAAIVAAVISTTPIVLLPMTRIVEKEKIGLHSVIGAGVAVAGVIGLTFCRLK